MDREAFEQLVNEWLDQPGCDDLRLKIDQAVADSPELASLRDEWLRLDTLTRGAAGTAADVNWDRLRKQINREILASDKQCELEDSYRRLTDIGRRVDWDRFRASIAHAVDESSNRSQVIRMPLRRFMSGIALIAAAAVFVLMVTLPSITSRHSSGIARVRVSGPVGTDQMLATAASYARVSVSQQFAADPDDDDRSSIKQTAQPLVAEVFLMVEPQRVAAQVSGSLTPFGFN